MRGDYTFGHEVNVFCPQNDDRCYWLAAGTSQSIRAQLKEAYAAGSSAPYQPVCLVVEGMIDRNSPRDGFAAEYDGLIQIETLTGACEQ